MKVVKRNGKVVSFDVEKITHAVHKACLEVDHETPLAFAEEVAREVSKKTQEMESVGVEEIQDFVEESLLGRNLQMAKRYILYRDAKSKRRDKKKKYNLLSDEFLSQYKHREDPLNNMGRFIFYRTYSRFLPEEGRREYWWETMARAVDYNCSLVPSTTREEAEELYDNVYNLKQALSGRTNYTGGTKASIRNPLSNFNCSHTVIDRMDALCDLYYVLMLGTGAGVGVQEIYTSNLPPIRKDIQLFHEPWEFTEKAFREDVTTTDVNGDTLRIIVGDSKEGLVEALRMFFNVHYLHSYRTVSKILVNYSYVRPKNERLETFGGFASGHESMKNMLHKIFRVFQSLEASEENRGVLRPIDVLDIANIIGENVVSGGVRRTAEIGFIDAHDEESFSAKSNLNEYKDGEWVTNPKISHRSVSNNSVMYEKKPTREELRNHIKVLRYSGEPGFVNAEAARKRRPFFRGLNPCGEVLMDSNAVCNLTTNNVMAFVKDGKIDMVGLKRAIELSVRAGYRMTCVTLELYNWDRIQKRDRLLGVSLTGYQDAVSFCGMDMEAQRGMLRELRQTAHEAMKKIAKETGGPESLLVTTVKPEGTLSKVMGGDSEGLHLSHSKFYIRHIRISATDPLVKVCEELGWFIYPENGEDMETCTTKVIAFPVASSATKFKKDVTAVEQMEIYKMFQEEYTDHNSSITVHVRDDEWEDVEEWLWENWDSFIGMSFLSDSDSFYKLMPYETIDEDTYLAMSEKVKRFNPALLKKYETTGESELDEESCKNGGCAVR